MWMACTLTVVKFQILHQSVRDLVVDACVEALGMLSIWHSDRSCFGTVKAQSIHAIFQIPPWPHNHKHPAVEKSAWLDVF